jgi:hypothetical protein
MADLGVHAADLGVHDADLRVHDGPIWLFTMVRNAHEAGFQVDILACAKCGGRMKVLAVIEQPAVVAKILGHLRMPTVPESVAKARAPPRQFDFDLDAA